MLSMLTGSGLAAAAGLNAYIPLLLVGLLSRYTEVLPLPAAWAWLEHPLAIGAFGVLFALEFFADKIPAVDTVNDVVQTVVRPTSGGITFGAGASAFTPDLAAASAGAAAGPAGAAAEAGGGQIWPIAAGVCIALVLHVLKALARPVLNAVSFGVAAPVVSVLEDIASAAMAVFAIVVPILVLVVLPAVVGVGIWAVLRRRRRRAERTAAG